MKTLIYCSSYFHRIIVKRRNMAIIVVVIVIVVIAGSVSYVLLTQNNKAPVQNTVTYYMDHDVLTLDPADAYDIGSYVPIQNVFDTLVTYPAGNIGTVLPDLATSWSVSPNGLVYTFHLRHNVTFSNGDPFTAQDVVFTFQRIITMNSPSSGVAWIDQQDLNTSSIKAIGNYTVQFTLMYQFSPFIQTLASAEPNGIVDMKVVQSNGGVVANQDNPWMANNTVGTGPYTLQSWTKSQQLVLVKNPNYWGGWSGNHYTKIVISLAVQPSTALSAAKSGAADIADIGASQAQALQNQTNLKVVATAVPNTEMVAFGLNSSSVMANTSVRQALSWAFPYTQVINTAFTGYASPLNGPIAPQIYLGQQAMPTKYYSYNLAKASQILNNAGFTNDSQGQRFNGTALSLYIDSSEPNEVIMGELYQASLAKIGVLLNIQKVPTSTYYSVRATTNWNMMIVRWGPDYNDPSDYALPFVGGKAIGGDNYNTHYNNSTINNAILNAMQTTNKSQEIADYHTVWNVSGENPSLIYACVTQWVDAVSNSLSNFTYNPILEFLFYTYVPSGSASAPLISTLSIAAMVNEVELSLPHLFLSF